jgi:hypothetical protein
MELYLHSPIRLHGVVRGLKKKHRGNFTFTLTDLRRIQVVFLYKFSIISTVDNGLSEVATMFIYSQTVTVVSISSETVFLCSESCIS